MSHPPIADFSIPRHKGILAQDPIDLPFLDTREEMRSVCNHKAFHADVDRRRQDNRSRQAAKDKRIVEARERRNWGVIERRPEVVEAVDLHEKKIANQMEERIEQVGN